MYSARNDGHRVEDPRGSTTDCARRSSSNSSSAVTIAASLRGRLPSEPRSAPEHDVPAAVGLLRMDHGNVGVEHPHRRQPLPLNRQSTNATESLHVARSVPA